MARLINKNASIPCGWVYLQAQTGKQFKSFNFQALVTEVVKHRKANPQHKLETDPGLVADEIEQYLVKTLLSDPRWHRFVAHGKVGASPPKPWSPQHILQSAGSAVGVARKFIRNTRAGVGTYVEWFGSGGVPVEKEEASRRASICVRCPRLVAGNFAQRWNKVAAYEIVSILGVVKDLNLSTPYDAQLDKKGICDACDCPMRAKVWSPLEVIKKHLRPDAAQHLWEQCWITDHAGRRSSIED